MKGCAAFLVFSIVVFAAVGYLGSPAAGIPDNLKFPVLVGGACVWFLGGGLIAQVNTNTRNLTPEELSRRGDVGCFTFVFLPIVMAMFAFAFIVWPALQKAGQ